MQNRRSVFIPSRRSGKQEVMRVWCEDELRLALRPLLSECAIPLDDKAVKAATVEALTAIRRRTPGWRVRGTVNLFTKKVSVEIERMTVNGGL